MEKIIAVVIMIVIVIGLIATVVMPQSQQVSTMGDSSKKQMDQFQRASESNAASGSAVRSDFALGNTNPKLVVLVDDDFEGSGTRADAVLTIVGGVATISTDTDVLSSDKTLATVTAGDSTPVISGATGATLTQLQYSALSSTQIVPEATYAKTEKTDANGVRFVLYVKQNMTN